MEFACQILFKNCVIPDPGYLDSFGLLVVEFDSIRAQMAVEHILAMQKSKRHQNLMHDLLNVVLRHPVIIR